MSTWGPDEGCRGDSNDVVYGPLANLREAETQRRGEQLISCISTKALREELQRREEAEKLEKKKRHEQLRRQLAQHANSLMESDSPLSPEESEILQRVAAVFSPSK